MKNKIKHIVLDLLLYEIGALIYSAAIAIFISPNKISPGGLMGIATLADYLFSIPSGLALMVLNIPILILGLKKFGGIFIIKTTVATLQLSVTLTVTEFLFPSFIMDQILASVFGGILMGLGLSIVHRRGATTGGVDIIAKLVNRRYRHLTVGRIILIIDAVVIFLAALIYRNTQTALYSIISMYASTKIMDEILYGADRGKMIYIVTKQSDKICKGINQDIKRGVTVLKAVGGYTGTELKLLLCTVRRYEVSAVYRVIEQSDKNAFIVVTDAGEIIGEGFKPNYMTKV